MTEDNQRGKLISYPIEFDNPNVRVGRFPNHMVPGDEPEISSFGFSFDKLVREENEQLFLDCELSQPQFPSCNIPQQNYPAITFENQIRQNVSLSEQSKYAFEDSVGRAYGKLVEKLNHEKMRESTVVSNHMTNVGFLRGKSFADGTTTYHTIAEASILEGKKWLIGGEECFILKLQNIRTGMIQKTPVLNVRDLESDKKMEVFLSKYFWPSDSRVYLSESMKDFRSRIYEVLNNLSAEELDMHVGWKQSEFYEYVDGSMYPLKESLIALLRKPGNIGDINPSQIISELCEELTLVDFDNRVYFLISYGLTACFSSICTLNWKKQPGLLLTGEQAVCREYAEYCLKFYRREDGNDILDLQDISEKWLSEYVGVICDDVLTLDCYDTARKVRLVKSVVSGGMVLNRKICVPIVVLQKHFNTDIEFTDFISVDMYGFANSEKLNRNMALLKGLLLNTIESLKINDLLEKQENAESFVEAFNAVMRFVRVVLIQAGVKPLLAETFIRNLEKGTSVMKERLKRSREIPSAIFQQRLKTLIHCGEIRVHDFFKDSSVDDAERAIWVKRDIAYIPAKYLLKGILPLMDMTRKDFKVVRDVLISKNILRVYNTEKEYTKDATLPNGKRVSVYEFDYTYICDTNKSS